MQKKRLGNSDMEITKNAMGRCFLLPRGVATVRSTLRGKAGYPGSAASPRRPLQAAPSARDARRQEFPPAGCQEWRVRADISPTEEIASSQPTSTSVGHSICASSAKSGRRAIPRAAAAIPRALPAAIRGCAIRGPGAAGRRTWPAPANAVASRRPARPGLRARGGWPFRRAPGRLRGVGAGPCVAKDQSAQPRAVILPELQGDVSAHRQTTQHHRLDDFQRIEQARQVVGELLHIGRVAAAGVLGEAADRGRSRGSGLPGHQSGRPTCYDPGESHGRAPADGRGRDRDRTDQCRGSWWMAWGSGGKD